MKDLVKSKLAAGGYRFNITSGKGNTRYGDAKKQEIIYALEDCWTEGVYLTDNGKIKRQLLNGTSQILNSNNSF